MYSQIREEPRYRQTLATDTRVVRSLIQSTAKLDAVLSGKIPDSGGSFLS